MRADERVFVLGEDVAEGGPYTATAGLAEEFGIDAGDQHADQRGGHHRRGDRRGAVRACARCSRSCSSTSSRSALDQLVNGAAKAHFMSGGQLRVPLVLRTQGGAGYRGAAQHSQSLESWLTHVPGLKVVMPSRPVDAAGLLASAIADPNPVVFIENKTLYFRTRRGARPGHAGSDRRGRHASRGQRRHDRRALAARPRRPRGGRAARRRGRDRGRGDRPAHARSPRSRGDRRLGRAHRASSSSPTRRSPTAASAPRSPRRSSGRRSTTSMRRSSASARRSRRSRSAHRSRTPTCRARATSSAPCGRC